MKDVAIREILKSNSLRYSNYRVTEITDCFIFITLVDIYKKTKFENNIVINNENKLIFQSGWKQV